MKLIIDKFTISHQLNQDQYLIMQLFQKRTNRVS